MGVVWCGSKGDDDDDDSMRKMIDLIEKEKEEEKSKNRISEAFTHVPLYPLIPAIKPQQPPIKQMGEDHLKC